MLPEHKKTLKSLVLTLRHLFEGEYDELGAWHPGDLERRLNGLGVFADREVPLHDMGQLPDADRRARDVTDAYIALRNSAGIPRETAVREYVRESAHTWANRLVALRMMEARGLIDEVVLARADYGNRSLEHHRALQADTSLRSLEDEGLASVFEDVFVRMSTQLPNLFEPTSPATALRPSTTALKKAIALLSGADAPRGQQPADDEVFIAPDALGWAYQYWNTEEKDRVFEAVRTKKAKISGDDIIPATQLYTEPYMVKFLVQNSLGATWMCMHPDSKLAESWEYYVADADRERMDLKPASELTFLDPACGSGHFLLEAFDMLFDFYEEEGERDASAIATSILEHNLYGIDIDERAVQIAEAALWMRAAERVPGFTGLPANLLATNIRLLEEKAGVDAYLAKHPEDAPLRPALEAVLSSLQHADELGSLLKLEEPIEDELKSLERAFERSSAKGTQVALFGETPVQGQLPVGVSSYDEWKRKVVGRLAEHFHDEAVSADAGAAWFGRSAGKGLELFELLSRRYDVVAANPPYMGSGNMGPVVRDYLALVYPAGRKDLYAAFMFRSIGLLESHGRAAVVTQHSWMMTGSFAQLRTNSGSGLVESTNVECIAHLGSGGFAEVGGSVVNTTLTVFATPVTQAHSVWGIRLVGLGDPAKIAAALSDTAARGTRASRVGQRTLLAIPGAALLFWIPDALLNAFESFTTIGDVLELREGPCTGEDARWLRYNWEVTFGTGWFSFPKGHGYAKWSGNDYTVIRWGIDGHPLRDFPGSIVPNPDWYFREGWHYSEAASGALGMRWLKSSRIPGNKAPGVFVKSGERASYPVLMNARVVSYLARCLSTSIDFGIGPLRAVPLPDVGASDELILLAAAEWCVSEKTMLVHEDLLDMECTPGGFRHSLASQSLRLSLEAGIEATALTLYGLDDAGRTQVLAETGSPAGFYPLVEDLGDLPCIPGGLTELPQAALAWVADHERIEFTPEEREAIHARLRGLYEAGRGSSGREIDAPESSAQGDSGSVASTPIPAETFLEELSQKLEIHPISVYWLLKEGIENDGWRCIPEERKALTDKVTVLVLRALGHRWPTEIEAGDPVAPYADSDGVIPISEGSNEPTLIERLRDVIEEETGTAAPTFEAHFADAMGISLEAWLATKFFAHHVKQFKKRPIAWHLVSSKPTTRRQPAFSALVYYHALDADLIPKIRSHYLSPLRSRAETELRGIEATTEAARSREQVSRRAELDERIAELKELDERLEYIELEGFESSELIKLIAKENIDAFCSVDGIKPKPGDTDSFVAQERAYVPDLNDGVRVNISPWQKAGVLAVDVLAKKDLDKGIADRARWRSDERRWCREGKLPRPGWWPEG